LIGTPALASGSGACANKQPASGSGRASERANQARLKNVMEFGKAEMSEGSEPHQSVLRATLYVIMELVKTSTVVKSSPIASST
jgi:hypothetical protein